MAVRGQSDKDTNFNPREYFDLALRIAHDHPNEVGFRTAINRVYYACHLVGADAAAKKGWFKYKDSAEDHRGLVRAIKDNGPSSLASKLRDLVELREHADYHMRRANAGRCRYCDEAVGTTNLVNAKTWQRAKDIATDILPKLEDINPMARRS